MPPKGKRLAAGTLGGNIHRATLYWLKNEGVDQSSVKISEVVFPQQAAQLESATVDAVEALEPFASVMVKDGAVDLGSPLLELGDKVSMSSWMASSEWAKDNPDKIEAFVRALEKAVAFIDSNEAEAREILRKKADFPEAVAKSVQRPVFDFALPDSDLELWKKVLKATN